MLQRLNQRFSFERMTLNFAVMALIGIALLTVVVFVPASGLFDLPKPANLGETYKAKVTRVVEQRSEIGPRGPQLYQKLEVKVGGQTITMERVQGDLDAGRLELEQGTGVLVTKTSGPDGDHYTIVDYNRDFPLWTLGLAFALLVIFVGRWQGFTSLIGMGASLLVILRFIIPGIVSGHDPVTISIIGSVVIMATSLYLAHGINRKTTTALIGTAFSLALTAGLASFAVGFAKLSGLADDQAATLNIVTGGGINPQGLLLGGMIIGALGVLDDVTVAQAASVYEIKSANPLLTSRQIFSRAMNIGRDHIASTVNTLFLAYAGAALPLLILLSLQTEPASVLVSRDFLSTEIVRTLVGSIGIVASVPITTALAAASTRWGEDGELAAADQS
jgi:uncharacterized membrane protein